MSRAKIVASAREWLGTPYQHQASLKGVGTDCLGLVRGIWREQIGREPEAVPPYSANWAEISGEETLLEAARRWLVEISVGDAGLGDVLVFRMTQGALAKHCAIQSAPDRIIHAYWGHAVVETRLVRWWARRAVAAFRFPEVN